MEDEAATLSSLDDELIMHIVLLDDMWRDVKSQRRGGPEPFDSVIYTLAQTCRRFAVLAHTRRPKRSRLREVGMLTKRMANFAHLIHVHRDREGYVLDEDDNLMPHELARNREIDRSQTHLEHITHFEIMRRERMCAYMELYKSAKEEITREALCPPYAMCYRPSDHTLLSKVHSELRLFYNPCGSFPIVIAIDAMCLNPDTFKRFVLVRMQREVGHGIYTKEGCASVQLHQPYEIFFAQNGEMVRMVRMIWEVGHYLHIDDGNFMRHGRLRGDPYPKRIPCNHVFGTMNIRNSFDLKETILRTMFLLKPGVSTSPGALRKTLDGMAQRRFEYPQEVRAQRGVLAAVFTAWAFLVPSEFSYARWLRPSIVERISEMESYCGRV